MIIATIGVLLGNIFAVFLFGFFNMALWFISIPLWFLGSFIYVFKRNKSPWSIGSVSSGLVARATWFLIVYRDKGKELFWLPYLFFTIAYVLWSLARLTEAHRKGLSYGEIGIGLTALAAGTAAYNKMAGHTKSDFWSH